MRPSNQGDKTPIELFIAGVEGSDAALQSVFAGVPNQLARSRCARCGSPGRFEAAVDVADVPNAISPRKSRPGALSNRSNVAEWTGKCLNRAP